MKRIIALLAILGFAGLTYADCGGCDTKAEGTCDSACAEGGTCCLETAMAKLPKITYRVSDHDACCAEAAKELAKDHDEPIIFVVDDTSYENEGEAYTALADVTEAFVASFAEPKTCSVSGTTSLAGQSLQCSEKAKMMATVIKDAMDTVAVSYKVGEEECNCPTQAATLAKESGETQMFVVGDAETCCAIDARIKVAQAKYKAALTALAKLQEESSESAEATVES